MIKSICIVRLSALGDVLMMVPLLRTLQHAYPQAKITWVVSPPASMMLEGIDGVELIVINKPDSIGDYWRFYRMMKHRYYDVLLAPQASLRANLLYPLIKAKRKIGYDSLRAKDKHGWFINEQIDAGNDHTLDGFLRFAEHLGVDKKIIRWDLPFSHHDQAFVREHRPEGNIMIVNPAASKPERSWLPDRYAKVIDHAYEHWQVTTVLTGGPGAYDRVLCDEIVKLCEHKDAIVDLAGKTKPKQLMALIASANVVLCPDTGPSHMASAVGTPAVALHAVTSAKVSGSYLYRHLAVDYYDQAVHQILNSNLEDNRWGKHAHGMDTMALVPVKDVIRQLEKVLISPAHQ